MYFKDLTKYKYTDKEDSLNIGWLEKGHMINKGDVPEEFIEKLWKYLRYPVNVCRGFHVCSLCKNIEKGVPVVAYKDEKRQAGYYEIRVWGKNGKVYAAPSLIMHYILQHGYRPPQEFINAVMDSEDASSDEYYQKVLDYSNGYGFWLEEDHTKVNSNKEVYNSNDKDIPIKIKDNFKSYSLLFLLGILAGIICRLSVFFPYESLWSLSSTAILFRFWIASVGVITCLSSSNIGAFINSFLYMSWYFVHYRHGRLV